MDSRERITRILNLEEPDVIAVQDFPWGETISRWRNEGFPLAGVEPGDYFGFEFYFISTDYSPRYEAFTLEETDRWRISTNAWGAVNKGWKGRSGTPALIRPAVNNLEEFKERIEAFLDIDDPRRIISPKYPFRGALEQGIKNLQKKYFVVASFLEPFEIGRALMGTERLCINFIRDPKFIFYMFDTYAKFLAECGKSLIDAGVDGLWAWGDIAYRDGPFVGPHHYQKLLAPAHRKIFSAFRKRGLPVILHTDGDARPLIPDFIKSGVTALQPLEAKAGMDVRELKEKYGDQLALIGNMDVRALSGTLEDVKREVLSKIPIACEGGGYILCSDHSVPPTVPLQNYEYMIKLAKKHGRYTP